MAVLVSIIVPVFNRASLVEETLESVRAQSHPHIELIVVDDGSTDNSAEVIRQWAQRSRVERCSLIVQPRNMGKCAAVNLGLVQSSGDFIMVLDSDDVLLGDAISVEVKFLDEHQDVGMVTARAYIMKGTEKTDRTLDLFRGMDSFVDMVSVHGDLLLKGNAVIASTALLRRCVIEQIGEYNESLRYTHDWEYWIRVSKRFKIGFLDQPVLYYRVNVAGASSLNRVGTFSECAALLVAERQSYDMRSMVRALRYQTKYNAWLAYHDGQLLSVLTIGVLGILALPRLIFGRKLLS